MSQYVYDPSFVNPSALARNPYAQQGQPLAPLQKQPVYPAQLGADTDTVQLLKDLLVIAGVLALAYWLLFSKSSPLKNPGRKGRNAVAKILKGNDGAWYWRLLRRRARRHGPFETASAAADDAESAGYKVLEA